MMANKLIEEEIRNKLSQKEYLIIKIKNNPKLLDELEWEIDQLNSHIISLIDHVRSQL